MAGIKIVRACLPASLPMMEKLDFRKKDMMNKLLVLKKVSVQKEPTGMRKALLSDRMPLFHLELLLSGNGSSA